MSRGRSWARARSSPPAPATAVPATDSSPGRLRELFQGRYLRRTVVVSALWFAAYYVNYGIATWMPSLYTKTFGPDLTTALVYTLLNNVTGLLGTLVIALILGPVVVGALLAAGGGLTLIFAQLACLAAVGAVIALFAVETKGRTLAQLNS
ncbi:hypothetical protein [Streptomyces lunalinharesii]|uniref:MFS transporter n=1 Tax=Streptomyces lunalinharesii TaxID=333384 RepID=A0ABP6E110_9ACTN